MPTSWDNFSGTDGSNIYSSVIFFEIPNFGKAKSPSAPLTLPLTTSLPYMKSGFLSAFLQLDIILDEDAFVHFYKGPTEILEPIASHTMFLIDLSRSMDGSKLIMAKESLILLLEDLSEKDYFKIIFFSEKITTITGW